MTLIFNQPSRPNRAHRGYPTFQAVFNSDCERCGVDICPGDQAAYIEGELICIMCMSDLDV